MDRRKFIKQTLITTAAATGVGTLVHAPNAIAKKKIRWRMVLAVPKTLPIWGEGAVRFAKKVKELSEGQLDIRVYGAGELVPGFGVFDAVKNGDVQLGHSASYYWIGKVPESPFFTTVPFGLNSAGQKGWVLTGGGQKLWDELYNPLGLMGLPFGATGVQAGGWFRKEINSMDDFKGLKMRMPGLGAKVLEKVGGKPMVVPASEIFTNLSTGVIDATEWVGPYHDYIMGFYKAAKYYYTPGWHEPGAMLELMINKKAFEKLPKHLQSIVRTCAQAEDQRMSIEWPAKDAEYFAKIKNEGKTQLRTFPNSVLKALHKASEEVKKELSETSPLAKKIYTSYMKFQATYNPYEGAMEFAYAKALRV